MDNLETLKAQFAVMESLVAQAGAGSIRGLIISGPAGVGKTFNIVKSLENYINSVAPLIGNEASMELCAGHMSTVGLVEALWRNKDASQTLVLDDIDSVLEDIKALNLLKAALDTGANRSISYMGQNAALKKIGVPQQFPYNGSIILITNQDMENCSSKMAPHFKALISRCFYFDLGFKTQEDSLTWIEYVATTSGMLGDDTACKDIIQYMKQHVGTLRELSLRTAVKIKKVYGSPNWQQIADFTLTGE